MGVFIGVIILELIFLLIFKKLRKYISEILILNVTTIIIYFLLMSNPFLKENVIFLHDYIVIFLLSISISLLIDTLVIKVAQKIREKRIINRYEKEYEKNELEYYRDILKEESPAILSICYNTRKTNFKDLIVSILLSLKQRNIIQILENDIEIIGDIKNLKNHEKLVLKYIECKYSPKKFKKEFYSTLIDDTKKTGYVFEEKSEKADMTEFAQIVIVIIVLFTIIVLFLLPFYGPLIQAFLELSDKDITDSKVGMLIFLAYAINFVSIPIYQWIEKRINLIVRTDSGFELCGKLKGLKRFLKEFSKLSDSELKQMALYDEYMIYSVVLNLKGKLDKEVKKLYDKLVGLPKLSVKNNIKRSNYKDEVFNKNIITTMTFIGFIWIYFLVEMIIERAYAAAIALFIPVFICITIVIVQVRKKRKFIKRRNILLTYGTKVPGIIVERKENCYYSDDGKRYYDYHVVVKFEHQGQVQKYKTPLLNFSLNRLISDDVDIYIYHGYCYVDNFKLKKEKSDR